MTTPLAPIPPAATAKGSYAFVSLGCPKNLVDSERMLGLLQLDGYRLVADPAGSDFVIVNTCGFIESARAESYATIREMLALKRRGEVGGVIVSGCLAERERQQLLDALPDIDHLVGVFARDEVTRVADRLVGGLNEQRAVFQPAPARALADNQRMRITPRHFAYLKISEGCDRLCTFCAIPKMRGKHATKPIEDVVAEARELVADGARELILVAQDTTYYGLDLYGRPRLADLLEALEPIDGLRWIRLMYLYPMYFDQRLIDVIAGSGRIVPYLDLPLQHINDTMLKRMQRRVTRAQTEALLDRLRGTIPKLALRTTFITGFPGETEEQFSELLEFAVERRFERVGVFSYSLEPETPAARLPDQVAADLKEDRRRRLLEAQQEVAFSFGRARVGQRLEVLVDRDVPDQPQAWVGRSYADAPDIDGLVYLTGRKLAPGRFVECEIVASQGYDLIGAAVGKPS